MNNQSFFMVLRRNFPYLLNADAIVLGILAVIQRKRLNQLLSEMPAAPFGSTMQFLQPAPMIASRLRNTTNAVCIHWRNNIPRTVNSTEWRGDRNRFDSMMGKLAGCVRALQHGRTEPVLLFTMFEDARELVRSVLGDAVQLASRAAPVGGEKNVKGNSADPDMAIVDLFNMAWRCQSLVVSEPTSTYLQLAAALGRTRSHRVLPMSELGAGCDVARAEPGGAYDRMQDRMEPKCPCRCGLSPLACNPAPSVKSPVHERSARPLRAHAPPPPRSAGAHMATWDTRGMQASLHLTT